MGQINKSEPPPVDAGLFGNPYEPEEAEVMVIGVPWEVTVSYGRGTSRTPEALVPASHQLDFFDLASQQEFGEKVAMASLDRRWLTENARCIELAEPIIAAGGAFDDNTRTNLEKVNAASARLNQELYEQSCHWQQMGKSTAVLGGDHSVPLGHIAACIETHPGAGILHIDAHHDLRVAYEGFTYSHASIMYNVLQEVNDVAQLTSVAIRDFCKEEFQFAQDHPKIETYYDTHLKQALFSGKTWHSLCEEIVEGLPQKVYISFDIDGLEPAFCPHTGTPVPGGLNFDQALHLLHTLSLSGRKVIGFDLCEVAPHPHHADNEWDLNVGARLLWHLCKLLAP